MSALELAESAARYAGFVSVAAAWTFAVYGALAGGHRSAGRAVGLARRHRAHSVYLLGAIPYFAICVVLWRPLPIDLGPDWRLAALLVGAPLGLAGATFYLWGRAALGSMYNVSSSLGAELYTPHRLITRGPYALVRHPMYLGLCFAACGGTLVYRTWTLVFMLATLPGALIKARHEERLLAAEFGAEWARYTRRVPAWCPRLHPKRKEAAGVTTSTS